MPPKYFLRPSPRSRYSGGGLVTNIFSRPKRMLSFIDQHQMQDNGETLQHELKRKEKIGLKLELGKCGKTKVFLIFTVFSFLKLL